MRCRKAGQTEARQVTIKMQGKTPTYLRTGLLCAILGASLALAGAQIPLQSAMQRASISTIGTASYSMVVADAAAPMEAEKDALTVRAYEGRVGVFRGNELWILTEIAVVSLPKVDQAALENGIAVADETEMQQLLEDLGA
jgi:hypothetical protein